MIRKALDTKIMHSLICFSFQANNNQNTHDLMLEILNKTKEILL